MTFTCLYVHVAPHSYLYVDLLLTRTIVGAQLLLLLW